MDKIRIIRRLDLLTLYMEKANTILQVYMEIIVLLSSGLKLKLIFTLGLNLKEL